MDKGSSLTPKIPAARAKENLNLNHVSPEQNIRVLDFAFRTKAEEES